MTLKSDTGGGLTPMPGLTMPGRFRDRGQTKSAPGPPGLGLGVRLTTPPRKKQHVTETTRRSHSGTLQWKRDVTSLDVSMTVPGETLQEVRPLMTAIFGAKANTGVGTWNVRTLSHRSGAEDYEGLPPTS